MTQFAIPCSIVNESTSRSQLEGCCNSIVGTEQPKCFVFSSAELLTDEEMRHQLFSIAQIRVGLQ